MIDDPLIMSILIASWIFALATLVLVLRWLFVRRRRHKAAVSSLHRDEKGVMVVPVLATFTGVTGLPSLVAIASNSLNPRLVIRPDGLDYRVTAARSVALDDIASVRIQTAPGTVNLVFSSVVSLSGQNREALFPPRSRLQPPTMPHRLRRGSGEGWVG